MRYYASLYYAVLQGASCKALQCTTLYSTVLCRTELHIALHQMHSSAPSALYYAGLPRRALPVHCTTVLCTARILYRTKLHCTAQSILFCTGFTLLCSTLSFPVMQIYLPSALLYRADWHCTADCALLHALYATVYAALPQALNMHTDTHSRLVASAFDHVIWHGGEYLAALALLVLETVVSHVRYRLPLALGNPC